MDLQPDISPSAALELFSFRLDLCNIPSTGRLPGRAALKSQSFFSWLPCDAPALILVIN